MTQNPFDPSGAPGGGFDMNALLQQAQAMQEQLVSAQAELEQAEVAGTSGPVTVTVNGVGELRAVRFAPGAVDAGDADALDDLGDLVVAAYRDARAQADRTAAEKLGPLAGGLEGLGGGMGGMGGGPSGGTPGLPGGIGF